MRTLVSKIAFHMKGPDAPFETAWVDGALGL